MDLYHKTSKKLWQGRNEISDDGTPLYWHQAVNLIDISSEELPDITIYQQGVAILGYACDEGVRRNLGRVGAVHGPDAVRKMMATMACHLSQVKIIDIGNVICNDQALKKSHERTTDLVKQLLENTYFPVLIGGGHDLAYAHYSGIRQYLKQSGGPSNIGIINLDAHFDLRDFVGQRNSGTPFSQIAIDCDKRGDAFNYLCLGIQEAANTKMLFDKAGELGVEYLLNYEFNLENWDYVEERLKVFIDQVDHLYLTIDLDGFSSAYAPGVSAPSPFGFDPGIAEKVIKLIADSGKLISLDLVELNPDYDVDNSTARLASRLVGLSIVNLENKTKA